MPDLDEQPDIRISGAVIDDLGAGGVQITLTVEAAMLLRAELTVFLEAHGMRLN